MGLNGQAHAGAVAEEWCEFKTQWLWFRLLRTQSRRECDQQQRNEDKRSDYLLSQIPASPILTLIPERPAEMTQPGHFAR